MGHDGVGECYVGWGGSCRGGVGHAGIGVGSHSVNFWTINFLTFYECLKLKK